jgi:hypothetical protein
MVGMVINQARIIASDWLVGAIYANKPTSNPTE